MIAHPNQTHLTPEQYLEWEKHQELKHEYIHGQVFAMAGASNAHVAIALNLASALRNDLRGGACRVFISDMKVQVQDNGPFYYPDILVTCDLGDRSADYVMRYPRLIVEVLSPSTEAFDRGHKFTDYRKLETLQEYVLIDTQRVSVECFRRNAEGRWVLYPYAEAEEVQLASLDFRCPISTLYEEVELGAQP